MKKKMTGADLMAGRHLTDKNDLFRRSCGRSSDELYRVECFLEGLKAFAPHKMQATIGGFISEVEVASNLLNSVLNGMEGE